MNRFLRVLLVCGILASFFGVIFTGAARSQGVTATQFQVSIDPTAHQKFGLYYPVTYAFQIPGGLSNLTAQYRISDSSPWVTLATRTAGEMFNGVNAARFDYPHSTAYLSAAFSLSSDTITLRVLDGENEVPLAFLGIPTYYDNRKAAVTVSLDDWTASSGVFFNNAGQILSQNGIHFSSAIITGANPDWSLIQSWVDSGYMEAASHSRSHACVEGDYSGPGYAYQVAGSKADILANLALPYPYVQTYIEPCGYTSPAVRQAVVSAGYLAERGFVQPPVENTFAAWGEDGAYQRVLYSVDTWSWPWYTQSASRLALANASFDAAYAAGGIYHLVDHPWQERWFGGSTLDSHSQYIGNRADVWYASFGDLYLYHFVQERGLATVLPYAGFSTTPLPSFTPTSSAPALTATPTATAVPPTATATSTSLAPTATNTSLPPTATSTSLPPTATPTLNPAAEYSLWSSSVVPAVPWINQPQAVEIGVKFIPAVDGYISGLRFYKGVGNTGAHTGHLWTSAGQQLAQAVFTGETASGWQTVSLATPVAVTANTTYVASYFSSQGNFAVNNAYFNTTYANYPLSAPSSSAAGGNGVYFYGPNGGFPNQTYGASNYWVDVIFRTSLPAATNTPEPPGGPGTTLTPAATSTTLPPAATNTSLPPAATSTALPPTATSTSVPPTATPTLNPAAEYSLWSSSAVPSTPWINQPQAVEIGVKFTAAVDGYISGVRFYKGTGNTGAHTGRLYTSSGQRLAEAVFTGETASGWQTVYFSTPVAVTANTSYVASYFSRRGNFAVNRLYFSTSYNNYPLSAPSSSASGGNGVYFYGANGGFPNQSYDASNYWVDVIFRTTMP